MCPLLRQGMVGRGQNNTTPPKEYVFAIAEALKTEYRAIVDAGFILQIDDPGLGETGHDDSSSPLEEYRRMARNIDALNHALAGILRSAATISVGAAGRPHVHDLGLRDIVDLLFRVKAQAYSGAATPRHAYEWRVWEDEAARGQGAHSRRHRAHHCSGRASRNGGGENSQLRRVVGRERVIAGADCGFAQGAMYQRQHPTVMWAKFEALVQGARLRLGTPRAVVALPARLSP